MHANILRTTIKIKRIQYITSKVVKKRKIKNSRPPKKTKQGGEKQKQNEMHLGII